MAYIFSILVSVLVFILIFSILILIHEFGHFIMAKRAKVKVEEFGIGLPPRAYTLFKKGDTKYTLNWIPFGGFVRLYGQDDLTGKTKKDPKSYQSKTIWQRIKIISAGVVMNFILAVVLIMIGFLFGMQPTIVGINDITDNVINNKITIQPYTVIKDVQVDSLASQVGLQAGDQIISVDNNRNTIIQSISNVFAEEQQHESSIRILRNNVESEVKISSSEALNNKSLGIVLFDNYTLPVLKIFDIPQNSIFKDYLKKGDFIIKINDQNIFTRDQMINVLSSQEKNIIEVIRDNRNKKISFKNELYPFLIRGFTHNSVAKDAGIIVDDKIISINNKPVFSIVDLQNALISGEENKISVMRKNRVKKFKIIPNEDGRIGVELSKISYGDVSNFSVQPSLLSFSITNYQKIPFYRAPWDALSESYRLSKLTVGMLGNVVTSIFQKFEIPEGVSGPVGIARMTYDFTQQGVLALIRLCALLSLSLGVLNIMPFPALDGGHLVFIGYEMVTGRKANRKVESIFHLIGFILLMSLIFFVTYNDIVSLF